MRNVYYFFFILVGCCFGCVPHGPLISFSSYEDMMLPVALAHDSLDMSVNFWGDIYVSVDSIDKGSYDEEGGITISFAPDTLITEKILSYKDFVIDNEHVSCVLSLWVTDQAGNKSRTATVITPRDELPPVAVAKSIFTLYVNEDGKGYISPGDVNNGSFDNFGPVSLSLDSPLVSKRYVLHDSVKTLSCRLIVTDMSGNTNSVVSKVIVVDTIPPRAYIRTGHISYYMPEGAAPLEIVARDLDAGSYDNCSKNLVYSFSPDTQDTIKSMALEPGETMNLFLWVTDVDGNQSSAGPTLFGRAPLKKEQKN